MQKYLQIITKMTESTMDIRRLNYLRLCLLKDEEENNILPFDFFLKTASKILNYPNFGDSEVYQLMKEVLTESNHTGGTSNGQESATVIGSEIEEGISLAKFSLLIDLYHYYPTMRKQDNNKSTELYYILSSNKAKGPNPFRGLTNNTTLDKGDTSRSIDVQDQMASRANTSSTLLRSSPNNNPVPNPSNFQSIFKTGSTQECLRLLSQKITERFRKFQHAFRFFDLHSSGMLTLADFSYAVDQLQMKFTRAQVAELFRRIDIDGDGLLCYKDFCELCEEKVREIDPFDGIVQTVKDRQRKRLIESHSQ